MKKVRITAGVLTAALIAASFAGCGEKTETQDVSAMKQEQGGSQDQGGMKAQRGTMGKVVSLDGDQLTVILADRPSRDGDGSTPPADGQAPADGNNPPAPPNGEPTTGPAIAGQGAPTGGPGQPGQGGGRIEYTGEQTTYTLSGDVAVMKGTGDSATEIDLSELNVGDVIRFTTVTDDSGKETIDTIVVIE